MAVNDHLVSDLCMLFAQTFFETYNTRLEQGGDEPYYLPANPQCPHHRILLARGYFSSGLHEIAHWCIAGQERRKLIDFGYWYQPEGRDKARQKSFEQVEVKPQAIEWAFCVAAGKKFHVSADNFNDDVVDHRAFQQAVYQQVLCYLADGFPKRAEQFINVLAEFYHTSWPLTAADFAWE